MKKEDYCFPEICNFQCATFKQGDCYPSIAEEIINRSIKKGEAKQIEEYAEKYGYPLKYWYFTFHHGSPLKDRFIKIYGTRESTRSSMIDIIGNTLFYQVDYVEFERERGLYSEIMFAELKHYLRNA